MKRLAALLFFCAAIARGQYTNFAHHGTATAGHANGLPAANFPALCSTTAVLGNFIYFSGSCWQALATPADGAYNVTFSSGVPSWTTASGATPSGTGVFHITGGVADAAAATLGGGLSFGTGVLTSTTIATDAVWTAANQFAISTGSGTATVVTAPTATGVPKNMQYDGVSAVAWNPVPYDLTKWSIVNQDFYQRGTAAGASSFNGFNVTASGTAAGVLLAANAYIGDSNHPNFTEITTGSTTTGGATLGQGTTLSSTAGGGWIVGGGEVVDWLVYVGTASGGTNTFRIYAGLCNTINNSVCTDGAFITWDNNTDTHWAVDTVKAAAHSGPTVSNLVATAAAWHHLKVTYIVASGFHFFVDGAELNVSPVNTDIPTNPVALEVKIIASAGCAAAATCTIDVNTIYGVKPVTR